MALRSLGIAIATPRRWNGHLMTVSRPCSVASLLGALLGPALDARHRGAIAHAAARATLDPRAFTPFFQPIVELESGEIAGFEALTRFATTGGTVTEPVVAFAAAARAGLGLELGRPRSLPPSDGVVLPYDAS